MEAAVQSTLSKEMIKTIGHSLGLNLTDQIASALASDAEYRMREVIQEASKFMMRSKREVLTTSDINSALRLRGVETLYGFSNGTAAVEFQSAAANTAIKFLHDPELEFDDIIKEELPPYPRDVCLSLHWMAVDGTQPAIPQNPAVPDVQPPLKKSRVDASLEFKQGVRHVLSRELHVLLDRLTVAIRSDAASEEVEAAIGTIKGDPAIAQLTPYLVQHITKKIAEESAILPALTNLIKAAKALVESSLASIEHYLQQLLPGLISCAVAKNMGERPEENHWAVRELAASTLSTIYHRFGDKYVTLLQRIVQAVSCVLEPKDAVRGYGPDDAPFFGSWFGAIVTFGMLGESVTASCTFPKLKAMTEFLRTYLQRPEDTQEKRDANMVYQALLNLCGVSVRRRKSRPTGMDEQTEKDAAALQEAFGDAAAQFL
eukprot:m51a1_g1885 hypothetical protein (431) ;mRNA; r:712151-713858